MNSEEELIERIQRALGADRRRPPTDNVRLGVGDDAAVLRTAPRREWVISCDGFLEGVHFLTPAHPPESVGYKSLARATSDLAAMGAAPRYFLLNLALPPRHTGRWLNRFLAGMRRAARELRIPLVGGDTSRACKVGINITVIGEIEPGRAVPRSGARPADLIYVSGRLGAAELGLELILRGLDRRPSLRPLLRAHLYPRPRVSLGRWLSQRRVATAMIDLSDGLSTDLARLCAASGTGARLWADRIPCVAIPLALTRNGGMGDINPLGLALHGGEDYELLFTVPPRRANLLRAAPGASQLVRIGEMTRGRQMLLIGSDGSLEPLVEGGWDPFRTKSRRRQVASALQLSGEGYGGCG